MAEYHYKMGSLQRTSNSRHTASSRASSVYDAFEELKMGKPSPQSIGILQAKLGNQQVIQLLRQYPPRIQRASPTVEDADNATNKTTGLSLGISAGAGQLDAAAKKFFTEKCLPMISHFSLLEKEMADLAVKAKPLYNQKKYYEYMLKQASTKDAIQEATKKLKSFTTQLGNLTEKIAQKKAMQERIGKQLKPMLSGKRFFQLPKVPDGITKANSAGTKAAIASFFLQMTTMFVDDPEAKAEIQKAADLMGVIATIADPVVDLFIGSSQTLYAMAKALFTEAATLDDVANDLIAGKMGPVHQGYAMIGDTASAAVTGQSTDVGDKAADGKLGTLPKIGADLGDALGELANLENPLDAITPNWDALF